MDSKKIVSYKCLVLLILFTFNVKAINLKDTNPVEDKFTTKDSVVIKDTIFIENVTIYRIVKRKLIKPYDLIGIPNIIYIKKGNSFGRDSLFKLNTYKEKCSVYLTPSDFIYLFNSASDSSKRITKNIDYSAGISWENANQTSSKRNKSFKWIINQRELKANVLFYVVEVNAFFFADRFPEAKKFIADMNTVFILTPDLDAVLKYYK